MNTASSLKAGNRAKPANKGFPTFSAAEKVLIDKLHGLLPSRRLLDLLNDRLLADMPNAKPHTMEQLLEEIGKSDDMPVGGQDWASLRKLLAKARSDGVLDLINEEVIDDFAVVFSLKINQVLKLKDILLGEAE